MYVFDAFRLWNGFLEASKLVYGCGFYVFWIDHLFCRVEGIGSAIRWSVCDMPGFAPKSGEGD